MRRALAITAFSVAAGLLAAIACNSPRPATCPGEPTGTFRFHADINPDAGSCAFSAGGLDFTGTIAYTSEGEAVLCLDRAEAQPLRGNRTGDHVILASDKTAANTPQCACAVQVAESVEGDVTRTDGVVVGFTGDLRNALTPASGADPSSCEVDMADAGPRCGVPCQLSWHLTGSPP